MADDELLDGAKGISEASGLPPDAVRREIASYPDPLPAKRFRGGLIWARRSRVELWRKRHPEITPTGRRRPTRPGDHPVPELEVARRLFRIAKLVRRSVAQCQKLLPWSSKPPADPLPVWKDRQGVLCAYRDALLDWLDRQSVPASSPRLRRKRWGKVARPRVLPRARHEAPSTAGPEGSTAPARTADPITRAAA